MEIINRLRENAIAGWLGRRTLEVGGWLGAVLSIVAALPPEHQAVIVAVLTGQGGALSIAAVLGFAAYIWSQIMSFRATVKDHAVIDGKKVPVLTEGQAKDIEEAATGVRPSHIPTRGK